MIDDDPEYKQFMSTQLKRDYNRCFWPLARCTKHPVRAHSIQNRRVLDLLSYRGHVITPETELTFDRPPKVVFRSVGTNKASTFTGLCSRHDSTLFRAIDTQPLDVSNAEHLFLVAYRSFLRELHAKIRAARDMSVMIDRGLGREELSLENPSYPVLFTAVMIIDAFSSYRFKLELDDIYRKKAFSRIKHELISASVPEPSVAVSSVFDCFEGTRPLEERMDSKPIVLNIIPEADSTCVIFSFRAGDEHAIRPQLDPMLTAQGRHQLYLISKLVLRHCENFVLAPAYFRKLSPARVNALIQYFTVNVFDRKVDFDNPDLYLF